MKQLNSIGWRSAGPPILAALVVAMVLACSCGFAAAATDLQKVHVRNRRKPSFTQVVLFFKGERPIKQGASPSGEEYALEFRHLTTIVKLDRVELEPPSTVDAITITSDPGKESRLHLHYRQPECTVKTMFLPATPPRPGFYRVALNIFPPISPQPEAALPVSAPATTTVTPSPPPTVSDATPPPDAPVAPAPQPLKLEEPPSVTYDVQISKEEEGVRAGYGEKLQEANRAYVHGDYQQAYELYERFLNTSPLRKDELTAARYGLADSFFALNEGHFDDKALEIFANYSLALKDGPTAPSAPWAIYRSGLAMVAAGNPTKAKTYFDEVVTQFPKHPAAPSAMLKLASIYMQEKAFLEAIQMLRKVLTYPIETPVKVDVYRRLGEALYAAGEHAGAIEAFNAAMKTDPDLYLKEPVMLRYLGEALFVEQKYDESRDKMFRYLNLRPDAPDRDLVLARIAEILTLQDEKDLAGRLYAYIQNTYPNSEGDVIAKIRRAEYLESKDKITVEEATAIYRDLLQKPLAPPLSRLVHFKYALRLFERGAFAECVNVLDDSLKNNPDKAPTDDFTALRSKAILGWCKQAHQQKDYGQVVHLHTSNANLFAANNSTEIDVMVADSYAHLKLFPNAIRLTQELIKRKGNPRDEELVLKVASYFLHSGDYRSAMHWAIQVQAPTLQAEKNLLLAQIMFAQAQYPQVIELLKGLPEKDKVSDVSPTRWYSLYAESYMHMGNCTKAAPWFDKALEALGKEPEKSEERLRLLMGQGTCYTSNNDTEKAVASLEAAALLAPSEELRCQLQYEVARVYAESGQAQKATQVLTGLLNSSLSLWQAAARQELDYLKLRESASR